MGNVEGGEEMKKIIKGWIDRQSIDYIVADTKKALWLRKKDIPEDFVNAMDCWVEYEPVKVKITIEVVK